MDIEIDGRIIAADPAHNLLQACLSAGQDLPYFCWHPAMGSVGSCRQCAVKIFSGPGDEKGQIVMACMTPITPGMRVSIADEQAAAFREKTVELILTNHPHDCPVCEVGGECHLQDMTVLTGHAARRTSAPKRTHKNQNLGPFIRHEMNRCIGCYRCVRFYQDYAGGKDFGVFGANRNIFFGRAEDGALESPFAGNLVEVCPTGVFVDKPFSANFRRKWDLRSTPSICPHCAVGCNITINERDGKFRRVVNRYNETLNGYFLCDRGRFGPGFLDSAQRLRASPLAREQLAAFTAAGNIIAIGSPRASIESNFMLRMLAGPENFYAGLSEHDADYLQTAIAIMRRIPIATLHDAERADAIFILGDDPTLAAPRLALSARQAANRPPEALLTERQIPTWHDSAARLAGAAHKTPFIIATPAPTQLDDVATSIIRDTADNLAAQAGGFAASLRDAKNPVIIAGGGTALIRAAANLAIATNARLAIMLPEANSLGLGLMDARPLSEAARAAPGKQIIILESDIFVRNPKTAAQIFATAAQICTLDHIRTATVEKSDLAIAIASFAESDGTFINQESRAQSFHKAIFGENEPPQPWQLLRDIAAPHLQTHADVLAALVAELPDFAACHAPDTSHAQLPTLPNRYSGRTAGQNIREPAPPAHQDSPYGTTMEGPAAATDAAIIWSPGWNSNQSINKHNPDSAPQTFLFQTPRQSQKFFELPPKPWSYQPATGTEEQSALSPAIIAREKS